MIILRKKSFSTEDCNNQIVEQREFNSKAAKELNNRFLKQIAAKYKIPVYESVEYKTKEIDPKVWKRIARAKQKFDDIFVAGNPVNRLINDGVPPVRTPNSYLSPFGDTESRGIGKKYYKSKDLKKYDHGVDDSFIIKNRDKRNIRSWKNALKRQRERRAEKL